MLSAFRVMGVDMRPPEISLPVQFVKMDLGPESSCLDFLQLLRDVRADYRHIAALPHVDLVQRLSAGEAVVLHDLVLRADAEHQQRHRYGKAGEKLSLYVHGCCLSFPLSRYSGRGPG